MTGVQTCALPILSSEASEGWSGGGDRSGRGRSGHAVCSVLLDGYPILDSAGAMKCCFSHCLLLGVEVLGPS